MVAGSSSLPAVVARGETGQFTGDVSRPVSVPAGCSARHAAGVSSEKLTANTATAGSSVNGAGGSSDHVACSAGPDTAGFSNSQRFPARHKCALALGKREFRAWQVPWVSMTKGRICVSMNFA